MELRRLGSSKLEVSPVIIDARAVGGWMWGSNESQAKANAKAMSFKLSAGELATFAA